MSDTKQQLVFELVEFSPKYNIVLAETIAKKLSEEEAGELVMRLHAVNDIRSEEMKQLEESNPDEYARRVAAREQEEEHADEAFFADLEAQMVEQTDKTDKAIAILEQQLDQEANAVDAAIDKDFDAAEQMIKTLISEIEIEESAGTGKPQEPSVE